MSADYPWGTNHVCQSPSEAKQWSRKTSGQFSSQFNHAHALPQNNHTSMCNKNTVRDFHSLHSTVKRCVLRSQDLTKSHHFHVICDSRRLAISCYFWLKDNSSEEDSTPNSVVPLPWPTKGPMVLMYYQCSCSRINHEIPKSYSTLSIRCQAFTKRGFFHDGLVLTAEYKQSGPSSHDCKFFQL